MSNSIEYQAGAAIVDDGIEFKIPIFWGKEKTFIIKPLRPGTIVRISMEVSKMKRIDESKLALQEILDKGGNLVNVAGIIANGIINCEITKRWKYRYYRWLLLNFVKDNNHLYAYLNIVFRQMGTDRFFFIMALTPMMNYLNQKEQPKAAERSGVR